MEVPAGRVLIVDDDPEALSWSASMVSSIGPAQVITATGALEAIDLVHSQAIDLVIAETAMRPVSGLEILEDVKRYRPSTLVVLTTAEADVASAVLAFRKGALDYLVKPLTREGMLSLVERALRLRSLGERRRRSLEELEGEKAKVSQLMSLVRDHFSGGNVLGTSDAIAPIYRIIEEVSRTDSTVLLTGESGTGKGVVARMIHAGSRRADRLFVEANCVIYSEGVLQSELFGHERGAFTGADKKKRGRFELAEGGTIFLDEVGEIGPSVQLMLLRFLQERRFERVGGEETMEADVRVIAATNRDLEAALTGGSFRRDLYYRLNVIPIALPPLRERREDIPLLARRIFDRCRDELGKKTGGVTAEAMEALVRYDWPGNVRELENVIERTLVLCSGEYIRMVDLPVSIRERRGGSLEGSLQHREREHILEALRSCGWNKKAAARALGIHRSSLYSKLRRYGIQPEH